MNSGLKLDTFLIYVQVDTRNLTPGDSETMATIGIEIVRNTVAPLEFRSLIGGLECQTLIYATTDVTSALEQIAVYCVQVQLMPHIKLGFTTEVIVFDNPLHTDFNHIYFMGMPEDE